MDANSFDLRDFWIQLQQSSEDDVCVTVSRWLRCNQGEVEWLKGLPDACGDAVPKLQREDLWGLYALSRVSDELISKVEQGSKFLEAYQLFMLGLGLQEVQETAFHPFYHEISHVRETAESDAPIEIQSTIWPGYMHGSLMISRAGVSVTGGKNRVKKRIAENSTIYWTYRRNARPCMDLSMGWGHNSQWRTSFRRDYRTATQFQYNVDGKREPSDPSLSEADRVELVRHRSFVLSEADASDLFPYHEVWADPRENQE